MKKILLLPIFAILIFAILPHNAYAANPQPPPTLTLSLTPTPGNPTDTTVSLSWNKIPGPPGSIDYSIGVSSSPSGPFTKVDDTFGNSYLVTTLSPVTTYYFEVNAITNGAPLPLATSNILSVITTQACTDGDPDTGYKLQIYSINHGSSCTFNVLSFSWGVKDNPGGSPYKNMDITMPTSTKSPLLDGYCSSTTSVGVLFTEKLSAGLGGTLQYFFNQVKCNSWQTTAGPTGQTDEIILSPPNAPQITVSPSQLPS